MPAAPLPSGCVRHCSHAGAPVPGKLRRCHRPSGPIGKSVASCWIALLCAPVQVWSCGVAWRGSCKGAQCPVRAGPKQHLRESHEHSQVTALGTEDLRVMQHGARTTCSLAVAPKHCVSPRIVQA